MGRLQTIVEGESRAICPMQYASKCSKSDKCAVALGTDPACHWNTFQGDLEFVTQSLKNQAENLGSRQARVLNPIINGHKPEDGICPIQISTRNLSQRRVEVKNDWED